MRAEIRPLWITVRSEKKKKNSSSEVQHAKFIHTSFTFFHKQCHRLVPYIVYI